MICAFIGGGDVTILDVIFVVAFDNQLQKVLSMYSRTSHSRTSE